MKCIFLATLLSSMSCNVYSTIARYLSGNKKITYYIDMSATNGVNTNDGKTKITTNIRVRGGCNGCICPSGQCSVRANNHT